MDRDGTQENHTFESLCSNGFVNNNPYSISPKVQDVNGLIIHSNELEPPSSPTPHLVYVIRPHCQKATTAPAISHSNHFLQTATAQWT